MSASTSGYIQMDLQKGKDKNQFKQIDWKKGEVQNQYIQMDLQNGKDKNQFNQIDWKKGEDQNQYI